MDDVMESLPIPDEARPMETAPLEADIELWYEGPIYGASGCEGWTPGKWIAGSGIAGGYFFAPEADDGFAEVFGGWRPTKSA